MKLEQQVCSLELAKRLKELGVKQESYFKWVDGMLWDNTMQSDYETPSTTPRNKWLSAFTVAELGEMLPKKVEQIETYGRSRTGFWLDISFDESSNKWRYSYSNHRANKCIEMLFEETEVDARAKMLIYLLENKLFTLP